MCRRSRFATLSAALLLSAASGGAQPSLIETERPVAIIDPDHFAPKNGNLHTPTPIVGYNGSVGRDVVFLFFHGGLWGYQPMSPYHSPCADGDNISVALIDPEDILTPAPDAVDDSNQSNYLYTKFPRLGRVSPCHTDNHAYVNDSTGERLGLAPIEDPNTGQTIVRGAWRHSQPFTDGGYLTDFNGRAGKFMIMSRGNNLTGGHDRTWLFRTENWNARKGKWNAGIFPLVTVDPAVMPQVGHVSPIMLPPTPTATTEDAQGRRIVTWKGYFRWKGHHMGRITVKFSPEKWGSVRPTRVWIEDQAGTFRALGSSGRLTFVPKKVHKEMTGRAGNPMQIYRDGSQLYLITREHQPSHGTHFPKDTNFANCVPGTPNHENIYKKQRGGTSYRVKVHRLTGPHNEHPMEGVFDSAYRTVDAQMPSAYSVSMVGVSLLELGGTLYMLSSDRLDTICSRLLCAGDGTANPFCGLQLSASRVNFIP